MSPQRAPGWSPARPTSLAGYLDALSKPVFSTGMGFRIIEAKWDGTREAFYGFDPQKVAALTPADVDRLAEDTRIIRNRKKIEATITNAERMIELDKEYGGFDQYLASLGSFPQVVAGLRGEFRFLGDMGAYLFLWSIDWPVPSHDVWREELEKQA